MFLVVAMELPPVLMNKELLKEKSTDGDWRLRSMWAYQDKQVDELLHKLFQWQLGGTGSEGQPSSRRCVLLCGGIGYVMLSCLHMPLPLYCSSCGSFKFIYKWRHS